MSRALIINVHDDGSATGIVGKRTQTFSDGSEKENFIEAIKWVNEQKCELESEV